MMRETLAFSGKGISEKMMYNTNTTLNTMSNGTNMVTGVVVMCTTASR